MVLLKQRFALAHVNVTDLPSSQCVASAGSTEGENAERLLAEGAESVVRIDAAPADERWGPRLFALWPLYSERGHLAAGRHYAEHRGERSAVNRDDVAVVGGSCRIDADPGEHVVPCEVGLDLSKREGLPRVRARVHVVGVPGLLESVGEVDGHAELVSPGHGGLAAVGDPDVL